MNYRPYILNTLRFLKEKQDSGAKSVDPRQDEEFKKLPEELQSQIRDKVVLYNFASFPDTGDNWKLAITWHTHGGVDVLNKSKARDILTPEGSVKFKHKFWNDIKKHATTIIVSVIGGLLVVWLSALLFKPKKAEEPNNLIWHIEQGTNQPPDSTTLDDELNDSLRSE